MDDETVERTEVRTRQAPQPSFRRFVLIFLFVMGLYIAFVPGAGDPFAAALGGVLNPLIGFGGRLPVVTLLVAGMLSSGISSLLRHRFTDWVNMARVTRSMSALQKARFEAMRKGNQAQVKRLREVQMRMLPETNAVQFKSMSSTAYTLFFFVILFIWLRLFVDNILAQQNNLLFAVPWSFDTLLTGVYVFPSWILLYSLLAIPFSQVVVRVLKYVSFSRRLRDLEAAGAPEAPA